MIRCSQPHFPCLISTEAEIPPQLKSTSEAKNTLFRITYIVWRIKGKPAWHLSPRGAEVGGHTQGREGGHLWEWKLGCKRGNVLCTWSPWSLWTKYMRIYYIFDNNHECSFQDPCGSSLILQGSFHDFCVLCVWRAVESVVLFTGPMPWLHQALTEEHRNSTSVNLYS
jgi:hypothetical protein